MTRVVRVAAVALALSACGGGGGSTAIVRATVAADVVPAQIKTNELHLVAYDTKDVKHAFAPKGARTLAEDAKVWEVRQADLLVGALEVVALGERADPADRDDRRSMISQAIPGSADRFDVEDVEVYAGRSGRRQLYCWFSNDLLVFLQLRGTALDGEAIVADLVRHQVTSPSWRSLPPIDEEDEG
ncbi:MAG: hypothetical protein QOD30_821 [Actinomycetota bacterium]|jgi:hypothetical protein|nr:hypothetical protein [Actinomycetota bacterium]